MYYVNYARWINVENHISAVLLSRTTPLVTVCCEVDITLLRTYGDADTIGDIIG